MRNDFLVRVFNPARVAHLQCFEGGKIVHEEKIL